MLFKYGKDKDLSAYSPNCLKYYHICNCLQELDQSGRGPCIQVGTKKLMEQQPKKKNRWWELVKLLFKVIVTLGALYWVSTQVDFQQVKVALQTADFRFLFLALLAYICSQVIASSRLYGYFKAIDLPVGEVYNFKLYLLGLFYNLFLPGGIGGDGYKFYFLRKRFGVKGKSLFSAILFDRISGLWALALITSALVIFIPQLAIPNWIPILVVCLGTLIYFLVLRQYFQIFIKGFVRSHLKAIGAWSFQIVTVIMLLYGLGFDGKFAPYLFSFLLSSLAAVLPFSVAGGLGLREFANVQGATFFHLDTHLALLLSLFFYMTAAVVALSGVYFIFRPQALGEKELPKRTEMEQVLQEGMKEEEETPEFR